MEQIEELFSQFCEKWQKESALEWEGPSKKWTEDILKYFRVLGKGYDVYPDPKHEDDYYRHQYLSLDQCWTTGKGQKPYHMQLALESEWLDPKEVEEDFWKLTELKCPWKVMVCSTEGKKQADSLVERLADVVKEHHFSSNDERYLVIVFHKNQSTSQSASYSISGYLINGNSSFRLLGTAPGRKMVSREFLGQGLSC